MSIVDEITEQKRLTALANKTKQDERTAYFDAEVSSGRYKSCKPPYSTELAAALDRAGIKPI